MGLFDGKYKNYGRSKDEVLAIQELVTGQKLNTIKLTKQQLDAGIEMSVSSHRKIIDDCIRLVNDTLTPEVFFDRYDLLIEEMTKLSTFEPYYNFNKSISEQVAVLRQKRPQNEIAFINKYYQSVRNASKSLKTEKAKIKRIQKFFAIMENYTPQMSSEALEFLHELSKEGDQLL